MKKLIVLRGNSGSGKTTVAKELQKKFGRCTMLISQDVIRRDILRVKDGEKTVAIPLMMDLLKYGYTNCNVVILEGIMRADWYRPLFELANQLYGVNIDAYYYDLPFEETMRRHLTKPNCHEFGEKEMRRWWLEKDFSDVLHEEKISLEKSKEEIIEQIFDRVMNEWRNSNETDTAISSFGRYT